MSHAELAQIIRNKAFECGFDDIGFAPIGPYAITEKNKKANTKVGSDATVFLQNAQTVVVLIKKIPLNLPAPQGVAEVILYYRETQTARELIAQMVNFMLSLGYEAVKARRFDLKAAAYMAGLGHYGKNGLLIHKRLGSYIYIEGIATDAKLSFGTPLKEVSICGTCTRCVEACPCNALIGDGNLRDMTCMREFMPGSPKTSDEMWAKMGNRLLGCEECQRVCPFNHKREGERVPYPARWEKLFAIDALGDDQQLMKNLPEIEKEIGANYAKKERLLRVGRHMQSLLPKV